MSARSTRNKLRWQITKVLEHLGKAQGHLKLLDDMAEGESGYINEHMPNMVELIEIAKKIFEKFREGL